jgi:glyceraldehyde 3-phosphate dehydrogenase
MASRVAINGFGRIGRPALKIALEKTDLEVVAINDLTDTETLAHLLKHDTIYGRYSKDVTCDEGHLIVEGKSIPVFAKKDPAELPWRDLNVHVVLECTGFFTTREKAKSHLAAGAKRVVISAPTGSSDVDTILLGVNEDKLAGQDIIANGSCTTNCVTPVAGVLEEHFGIDKALMTTIHAITSTQNLVDGPNKDLRRARAAGFNIVPTSTGAAEATVRALPVLEGKFDGLSIRVPVATVSLADVTVLTKQKTSIDEVNTVFTRAKDHPLYRGILTTTDEPAVSSDFIGDPHSAIVDLTLTNVVGGNLVKVVAWYDNEWGYANRLVEQAIAAGRTLS